MGGKPLSLFWWGCWWRWRGHRTTMTTTLSHRLRGPMLTRELGTVGSTVVWASGLGTVASIVEWESELGTATSQGVSAREPGIQPFQAVWESGSGTVVFQVEWGSEVCRRWQRVCQQRASCDVSWKLHS